MKRRSFFWHIIPWIIGLGLLLGPFSTYVAFNMAKKVLLDQIQRSLLAQAKSIVPLLEERYLRAGQAGLQEVIKTEDHDNVRISVIALDGSVLAETHASIENLENHQNRAEIQDAIRLGTGSSWRFSETLKQNFYYVAVPVSVRRAEGRETVAVLRLSTQVRQIDELMKTLKNEMLVGGAVALIFSMLFGITMARYLAKPLEAITQQLSNHAHNLSDVRISTHELYPQEIKNLIEGINAMALSIQKRTEKSSKQESELLTVFSSLTEGVLTVDTQKNVFHFNQQFVRMFQLPANQLKKGRPVEEVLPLTAILELIDDVLKHCHLVELEWVWANASNDDEGNYVLKGSPLLSPQGDLMGVLIVANDLTKMKRLESHRKQFVANVGHELRTPLTAIQGYLETLVEGKVDDPVMRQKFLQKSHKQSIRLARLVDDLFRLAQIERDGDAGDIDMQECNLAHVIESALETVQGKASLKKMQLDIHAHQSLMLNIHAGLVELAIVNLLDNAIKYSPEGEHIEIDYGVVQGRAFVRISDHGPGIDPVHHARLFERFYCVDKARSREMGGTGLGLSIVKHIAMAHGGDVEVGGNVGQGSVFTLWLRANTVGV